MLQSDLNREKGMGVVRSRLNEIVAQRENEIGQRIQQRAIAEQTGLNPNTISRWMSPEPLTKIDSVTVIALCRYFGVQIGDLLVIDYGIPSN